MEEMGFDLLRFIWMSIVYLNKEISLGESAGMSQERLERVGVGNFFAYVHL
jgi:hypothetical protein